MRALPCGRSGRIVLYGGPDGVPAARFFRRSPARRFTGEAGAAPELRQAAHAKGFLSDRRLVFDGLWCPRETRCAALENAASERGHAVAQRPETVQARSLSPGLGGEFRVMPRIARFAETAWSIDLSCER
jgi:hypothetical protein